MGVDQKLSSKGVIAEWIASLFESVWIVRSNHVQGGHFFAFNYFFRITKAASIVHATKSVFCPLSARFQQAGFRSFLCCMCCTSMQQMKRKTKKTHSINRWKKSAFFVFIFICCILVQYMQHKKERKTAY